MKVSNITNFNLPRLTFGRPIREDEKTDYHQTLEEGKKYLGIRNLAIILHGSSFPVAENDLYIGSPINNKAKEVNEFFKLHGFDSIQLGPPGLIQPKDPSPYESSIYSRNYLFTDMDELTKPSYAKILTPEDIKEITDKNYINNSNETDFVAAFAAYDKLFEKGLNNLFTKVKAGDEDAVRLNEQFTEFKNKNRDWLESDALFEVLSKTKGNDDFENWDDISQNLIKYLNDKDSPRHEEAVDFKHKLFASHSKDLELYSFKQFVVKKQEKEFSGFKDKLNYMSDSIIGFSPRDVWAHQEAFLKNYRIGCPYGGDGKAIWWSSWGENQLWDIPLVNPETLFNDDSSIGAGGKLIQEKFRSLLENHQNIRIDHVLGLVDPWVYDKTRLEIIYEDKWNDKGEKYTVKHNIAHGANISMFGKPNAYKIEGHWCEEQKNMQRIINEDIEKMPNIDPQGKYKRIIHEIILPLMDELGVNPNEAAWENLGSPTNTFNEVCYGQGGKRAEGDNRKIIPGMSSLKSYRGEDEARNVPDNTMLIQTHDDEGTGLLMTNNFYQEKKESVMNPFYLIGSLYPDYADTPNEEKGIEYKDSKKFLFNRLENDTDFRTLTKWQELMRYGRNLQYTFIDFFGLKERYNYSGTSNPKNWKLRLTKDYQEQYYKTLERAKHDDGKDPQWWNHIAMNMPEIIKRAVISKTMNEGKDIKEVKPLIDKLNHYEKVLYEKSGD